MVASAQPCTARLVKAGLHVAVTCGDSASTPPRCASHEAWNIAMQHNGSRVPAGGRRCARNAWDAYLCALPARVGDDELKPADWAFGSMPPSVGKQVAHFALQLFLSGARAKQPFRHTLPSDFLRDWRWRPQPSSCPTTAARHAHSDEAWLRADVCAPFSAEAVPAKVPASSIRFTEVRAGARVLELVRGNSSGHWARTADLMWVATVGGGATSAGLWVAGQAVRRVRQAIGPCTHARVDELLLSARQRLRADESAHADGSARGVPQTWAPSAAGARDGDVVEDEDWRRAAWRPAIAVHIRRGDACETWAGHSGDARTAPANSARPCFGVATYLSAARALLGVLVADGSGGSGGIPSRRVRRWRASQRDGRSRPPWLLVATDSPVAIDELRTAMRAGEFDILHAGGPRGAGWGGVAEATGGGQARREFIEARNDRGLVDRAAVVASFFADLELLAHADAFVGTAASWTSRVALLALVGETGALPPFAMVDRPIGTKLFFA